MKKHLALSAPQPTLPGRTLISSRRIQKRIKELAEEIQKHYRRKPLTLIALLHGSIFFLTDLVRYLPYHVQIECWNISSYENKRSTGIVKGLEYHKSDYSKRHVLLIDDILDTGLTLFKTISHLNGLGAKDVKSCVLLVKKIERPYPVMPTWWGFEIPNQFVVGYGLDLNDKYRPLPMIRTID
ncbi:MAG: hypoxanthine phosphoribosyltransferase [Verrucomicrobiota bacterium]